MEVDLTGSCEQKIYYELMESIKSRIILISKISSGKFSSGDIRHDTESAYLHLRKVLELIAFSSLVVNKDLYVKARSDCEYVWRANKLLEYIKAINPNFYPIPVEVMTAANNPSLAGIRKFSGDYLAVEDFEELYNLCGDLMHADNPFGKKKDYNEYFLKIKGWARKIHELLDMHVVRFVDSDKFRLIEMSPKHGPIKKLMFVHL